MITPNSINISVFDFNPEWDLSGVVPVLHITNLSTGDMLEGVSYWFEAYTGGASRFHQGTQATPDKSGIWTSFDVSEPLTQVLGHVEWSGNDFNVIGSARDSVGQVFSFAKSTRVCRPPGNTSSPATPNNFGVGSLDIRTLCDRARLYVEDKTDYSYQGLGGLSFQKQIKLIYPPDGTGTPPAPKVILDANNALIPLLRNGDGFIIVLSAYYVYQFPNGSSVKLQFKFQKVFSVKCNVDLCPLIADIQRLEHYYERNGCDADDRSKLALINSKLNRALMAKIQPLCDVDVSQIVDEIKALGGFTCDCTGSDFYGVNVMQNADIGGSGIGCNDIITCVNDALSTLDPQCMAISLVDWEGMSFTAKFQKILNFFCCASIADIQAS